MSKIYKQHSIERGSFGTLFSVVMNIETCTFFTKRHDRQPAFRGTREASSSLLVSTNGCQYRAVFRHYTNHTFRFPKVTLFHASRPPKITLFTDRPLSTNTPRCTQRDTKSLHKKTHILSVTDTHKTPKRPPHTNTKRHPNAPEAAACGDGNTPYRDPYRDSKRTPANTRSRTTRIRLYSYIPL